MLGVTEQIHFLDPAFGTGSFYSALLNSSVASRVEEADGFEIDPHYGRPTQNLWADTRLNLSLTDFTKAKPHPCNFLICNPPYVRHHHLSADDKTRLREASHALGVKLSGLAGLYCYFMVLAHRWLQENAVAAWLIPSEFMDVNYGEAIKSYLLDNVTLVRIHRFDPNDVQFADALVSSAIVWFKNTPPAANHRVQMTLGGRLDTPLLSNDVPIEELRRESKWTRLPETGELHQDPEGGVRLRDLFNIKRGLATGDNSFFILNEERVAELGISHRFLQSILPSPRYLKQDEVQADEDGLPLLKPRLFLINTKLPEEDLREADWKLAAYLESGKKTVAEAYLCRSRKPWYSQETRPPAPILCTYMGRSDENGENTFRFILNHSKATAANVYLLLYPKATVANAMSLPGVAKQVFELLREIPMQHMRNEGRVYGGGLHKMEPRELANVRADHIAKLLFSSQPLCGLQIKLPQPETAA